MAKKARRNSRKYNGTTELELVHNDNLARREGPKRKTWNVLDLKAIKPLTETQHDMFQCWYQGDNICAHGYAGTGKTFLAFYLALHELLERKEQQKIIVIRSAVPTREIGHLPGTLEEKIALYELPYHDICHELVGRRSTYQDMKDARKIEFMCTSFIRGLTWDNAIIIFDEVQNASWAEINTVMTRVGENSRIILAGDIHQNDLINKRNDTSGCERMLSAIEHMENFANIQFSSDDIIRSAFVKSWIIASQSVAC